MSNPLVLDAVEGFVASIAGDSINANMRITLVAPTVDVFMAAHKAGLRHLGQPFREGEGANIYSIVWKGTNVEVTLTVAVDLLMQSIKTPTAADVVAQLKEKQ